MTLDQQSATPWLKTIFRLDDYGLPRVIAQIIGNGGDFIAAAVE